VSDPVKNDTLVEVKDLVKWFPIQQSMLERVLSRRQEQVRAVDTISFTIQRGEVFGLAGESGSGKTTTGRLVLRLIEPTAGQVLFDGIDLSSLSGEEMRRLRRRMQAIFQDPFASLNPRMKLGNAIGHSLKIHGLAEGDELHHQVNTIMEHVGLTPPDFFYDKYPHQISGGQRQRVVVARALVTRPELVLADEPIAMADVSVRAQLLDLLKSLRDEFNLTYLFITHDLATAKYICDRIAVMYLGKISELGELLQVYRKALHPYTRALLEAVPVPDPKSRRTEALPRGEIPSPINPPPGCRFHPRCPIAKPDCSEVEPELRELEPGHLVACHYAEQFL
jgi:peptide/nickel transport system ATP-binding protein